VAYFPEQDHEVIETFDKVAASIRSGYMIGYVPTNTARDGAYRHVKVEVHAAGHKNLRVRNRAGYRVLDHVDAQ
jgi:hypothetical protein